MPERKLWRPVEVIVAVMTATVCTTVVIGAVAGIFRTGGQWTDDDTQLIGSLLGALIAIISLWVGAQFKSGPE